MTVVLKKAHENIQMIRKKQEVKTAELLDRGRVTRELYFERIAKAAMTSPTTKGDTNIEEPKEETESRPERLHDVSVDVR